MESYALAPLLGGVPFTPVGRPLNLDSPGSPDRPYRGKSGSPDQPHPWKSVGIWLPSTDLLIRSKGHQSRPSVGGALLGVALRGPWPPLLPPSLHSRLGLHSPSPHELRWAPLCGGLVVKEGAAVVLLHALGRPRVTIVDERTRRTMFPPRLRFVQGT